jgi:hypothetical protein
VSIFDWGFRAEILFPLLYGLAFISAVGLLLGVYVRLSAVLAWFCACMFTGPVNLGLTGGDTLMRVNSFYLMIGALAGYGHLHYSLATRNDPPAEPVPLMPLWIYRMFQLQLCLIYFYAGLGKVAMAQWQNGTAMNIWVHAKDSWMAYDYTWILDYPSLGVGITLTVWFWELILFPFGVWNRSIRPWALWIGVCFQLGIIFGMRVYPFGPVPLVLYLCFVKDSEIDWLETQLKDIRERYIDHFFKKPLKKAE